MVNHNIFFVIILRKNYNHVVSGEVVKVSGLKRQKYKYYHFENIKELLRILT